MLILSHRTHPKIDLLARQKCHSYTYRRSSFTTCPCRFTIAVPPTTAPQISLHCHHPPPSHALRETELADAISRHLSPASSLLHTAATAASLQFPETRLIQYDCGKLMHLYQPFLNPSSSRQPTIPPRVHVFLSPSPPSLQGSYRCWTLCCSS